MFICCVCGKEFDEVDLVCDEEMGNYYCKDCYLAEYTEE